MTSKLILVVCLLFLIVPIPALSQDSSLIASLTIDGKASVTTDRLVIIVSGRYTCGTDQPPSPGTDVTGGIAFTVSQAARRQIASGFATFVPVCNGIEQTFQINVQSQNIPFHGGQARAHANMYVQLCSQNQCPIA